MRKDTKNLLLVLLLDLLGVVHLKIVGMKYRQKRIALFHLKMRAIQ